MKRTRIIILAILLLIPVGTLVYAWGKKKPAPKPKARAETTIPNPLLPTNTPKVTINESANVYDSVSFEAGVVYALLAADDLYQIRQRPSQSLKNMPTQLYLATIKAAAIDMAKKNQKQIVTRKALLIKK
jgi:hypothetical protein